MPSMRWRPSLLRTGQIAPSEGEALASLVQIRARLINDVELNSRLDDIESARADDGSKLATTNLES